MKKILITAISLIWVMGCAVHNPVRQTLAPVRVQTAAEQGRKSILPKEILARKTPNELMEAGAESKKTEKVEKQKDINTPPTAVSPEIEARFSKIENKLKNHEGRLATVETKIAEHDKELMQIKQEIAAFKENNGELIAQYSEQLAKFYPDRAITQRDKRDYVAIKEMNMAKSIFIGPFRTGDTNLTNTMKAKLLAIAEMVKKWEGSNTSQKLEMTVTAFASASGSTSANQHVKAARAKAGATFLEAELGEKIIQKIGDTAAVNSRYYQSLEISFQQISMSEPAKASTTEKK
jgi:outer membrane protein OmpA-like peptidoglycan-associated protein